MASKYNGQWKTLFSVYPNKNGCQKDLSPVLNKYSDLRMNKRSFVFNNGGTKDLVCLEGTMPIVYKGVTYNIPMAIWLKESHPKEAPMVFVTPTSTMSIRSGPHVDSNGAVTLPYIAQWRNGSSNSSALLDHLTALFAQKPPVFSKPARPPPPVLGNGPGYPTTTQSTPYPAAGVSSMPVPQPPHAPYQGAYPQTQPGPPAAYPPATQSAYQPGSYPTQQPAHPAYPVYGGYPAAPYNQPSGYMAGNNPYPPAAGHTQSAYPPAAPLPYPSATPQPGLAYPGGPPVVPTTASHSMYQSNPPYATPAGTAGAVPHQAFGSTGHSKMDESDTTPSIDESEVKLSLVSAVEDKARWSLREIVNVIQDEMSVLGRQQSELKEGQDRLMQMEKDMSKEQENLERLQITLTSTKEDLTEKLGKLGSQKELDPEDAIDTTTPVYKQLLNAFAEEQGVEDTMYCLGEALTKEIIDLDAYLKKIRELSRMQFTHKVVIDKCRKKAGLASV